MSGYPSTGPTRGVITDLSEGLASDNPTYRSGVPRALILQTGLGTRGNTEPFGVPQQALSDGDTGVA